MPKALTGSLALAIVMGTAACTDHPSAPREHTLHGTLHNARCSGGPMFEGAEVDVRSADGDLLAVGKVAGTPATMMPVAPTRGPCSYRYRVAGVADKPGVYTVTIQHISWRVSRRNLAARNWIANLTVNRTH